MSGRGESAGRGNQTPARRAVPLLAALLAFTLSAPRVCLNDAAAKPRAAARQQEQVTRFRQVEPNRHAPELYADKLKLRISLVDLPGAREADSDCVIEYQLYFIPEEDFQRLMRSVGGRLKGLPDLSAFPGKVLLAGGKFKPARLSTLKGRTFLHQGINFKDKVPDRLRTKFANLVTRFSVKINDARLNTMVFDASSFLTHPFDDDPSNPERAIPRSTIYLNFYVSPQGDLFKSQLPRRDSDTSWGH
jgi:hypothetical protein